MLPKIMWIVYCVTLKGTKCIRNKAETALFPLYYIPRK